jgi:hypothetical protein
MSDDSPVSLPQPTPFYNRKSESNRANAQKSTGPRTPQGKARSRLNALKQGLFARNLLSTLSPEESAKFKKLLRDLAVHYRPANIAEDLLVQQIAECFWSLARIQRVDSWTLQAFERCARQAHEELISSIIVPEEGERMSHYGPRFERKLSKAISELERLQAARLAGSAPPKTTSDDLVDSEL